jgi:membrane complex biogenesis BtpA family protein
MLPKRALIGMVHVHALPGTPASRLSVDDIVKAAAAEARILTESGFDGIIVENMHDRPYVHGAKPPEVIAAMTRACAAVAEVAAKLTRGIQILSGGNKEAVAVAAATGGSFIRCENFVFSHIADEGLLTEAEAGPLLRYRKSIGAESVRVFADIKKKHASHALTLDVTLAETAEAAEFFGADGVIVTGAATGKPTAHGDVAAVRKVTKLPVLVGSGVTPDQVKPLFDAGADALIVGSWIKKDGVWMNAVDSARCLKLTAARA